jgi:sugar transferase (PEP-CTERM system associated)
VGAGPEAAAVGRALSQAAHRGVKFVGFYATGNDDITVPASKLLQTSGSIADAVRKYGVKEIIVALRERRGDSSALNQLLSCKLGGVRVVEQSTFFERITGEVKVDTLKASWLIYGDGFRQGWMRNLVKRSFDIACAVVLLVVTLPVMLLAAAAVMLTSAGPLLYRQERVGQNGRTFTVMKFRSMCANAEAGGVPQWAKANDARVTSVGRIMRRTRIDELPQIFNVLNGDMSFVGPRPERPFFVDQLTDEIPFYAARHSVKPGITGWAQVNYKYGSNAQDALHKLQFDLYYVKNHTLFLDLLVLIKTVKVVLSGEGAH